MRRCLLHVGHGTREDTFVKVEIYNAIMQRQKMSRRRMLKGAASVGAVTALGGLGAGLTARPAMAQDAALRAEILNDDRAGLSLIHI